MSFHNSIWLYVSENFNFLENKENLLRQLQKTITDYEKKGLKNFLICLLFPSAVKLWNNLSHVKNINEYENETKYTAISPKGQRLWH